MNKSEPVGVVLRAVHRLWDPVRTWLARFVMPKFLGVSVVAPSADLLSRYLITHWMSRGLAVMAWTSNEPLDRDWLLAQGVSVCTDRCF